MAFISSSDETDYKMIEFSVKFSLGAKKQELCWAERKPCSLLCVVYGLNYRGKPFYNCISCMGLGGLETLFNFEYFCSSVFSGKHISDFRVV